MNTHVDKTQRNKSQSVANETSQKMSGGESNFQFVNNRPEAIAQRRLQEMANNSPQAKQTAQLQAKVDNHAHQQQQPIQKKENNTGLPDNLKTGMENLSGISLDDVNVHRNSDKPAQLNAHAYAQGTDIHLGSGQEKHLPHEAWHVVQQKQGRVRPTTQMKGKVNVNDDDGLEKEADVMGAKALSMPAKSENQTLQKINSMQFQKSKEQTNDIVQRAVDVGRGSFDTKNYETYVKQGSPTPHYRKLGAKIIVEFTPNSQFGENGDRISLVQSVKDTMTLSKKRFTSSGATVFDSERTSDLNIKAGFDKRTTANDWAIDQQLTNDAGDLVNLDPRYAEQRLDEKADYKQRPKGDLSTLQTEGGGLVQGMVVSAVKSGDIWTTALLSDEPTIPHPTLKKLQGKQEFEVVAMYEPIVGDSQYIGSVKWGWQSDGEGNLTLLNFEIGSHGLASVEFVEAAEAWNKMDLDVLHLP